ncbi:hypothetical protein ACFQ1E_18655 [Sphingomonas canadensis]|uniref:BON domain-containing protein n=1 Tax=Sphingomonas canadensis TaxID=1219257 RepID=A0ABW3HA49_9SPHN|nr:hypothetical protein [Sphingomonas canadensis]MCW3838096.1 hypothetical protein [Sphingomonas canadensis]
MAAARFEIAGDACPQLLNRLLGLLAQQDRVPDSVIARREGDMLSIGIAIDGIDPHRAEIIAEKMRSMVSVLHVQTQLD